MWPVFLSVFCNIWLRQIVGGKNVFFNTNIFQSFVGIIVESYDIYHEGVGRELTKQRIIDLDNVLEFSGM